MYAHVGRNSVERAKDVANGIKVPNAINNAFKELAKDFLNVCHILG